MLLQTLTSHTGTTPDVWRISFSGWALEHLSETYARELVAGIGDRRRAVVSRSEFGAVTHQSSAIQSVQSPNVLDVPLASSTSVTASLTLVLIATGNIMMNGPSV